jgi:hypothetical protein
MGLKITVFSYSLWASPPGRKWRHGRRCGLLRGTPAHITVAAIGAAGDACKLPLRVRSVDARQSTLE